VRDIPLLEEWDGKLKNAGAVDYIDEFIKLDILW
jgi:hypothetical protein